MRSLLPVCLLFAACATPEPVQDPLDYLRIGIDPSVEAKAVRRDLSRDGYTIGHAIEGSRYVAFEALRPPDTTVRVFTERGPAFSIQTPDVRAPHLGGVMLGSGTRPDFDRDGEPDIIVEMKELDRTCLLWLQIDRQGFVTVVFEPNPGWGDAPCVIEIDSTWPRLLLEVTVPAQPRPDARVIVPIHAATRGWIVDESPSATAHWTREIERRRDALASARSAGDSTTIARLASELAWIETLRATNAPMLEAPQDGEEAR